MSKAMKKKFALKAMSKNRADPTNMTAEEKTQAKKGLLEDLKSLVNKSIILVH